MLEAKLVRGLRDSSDSSQRNFLLIVHPDWKQLEHCPADKTLNLPYRLCETDTLSPLPDQKTFNIREYSPVLVNALLLSFLLLHVALHCNYVTPVSDSACLKTSEQPDSTTSFNQLSCGKRLFACEQNQQWECWEGKTAVFQHIGTLPNVSPVTVAGKLAAHCEATGTGGWILVRPQGPPHCQLMCPIPCPISPLP